MNERPWQSNLWQNLDTVPRPKAYEVIPAYLLLEHGQVTRGIIFQASVDGCTGIHFGTVDQEILHGVRKWQPVLGLGGRSSADRLPVEEEIFNDLVKPHGWTSMEYAPQGNITSWILTTHGKVEEAKCYLDEKNRPYWGPDEGCRLKAVAWKQRVHGGEKPERPDRKTGRWPDEVERPAEHEHALKDWFKGSNSGSHEPVTVVIDADRDLHLKLPNDLWRHKSYLPQRLEEGDEDLTGEFVWALQLDGSIVQAKASRNPDGTVRWLVEGHENSMVAWTPFARDLGVPELPLLYHGATNSPVSWRLILELGDSPVPAKPSSQHDHPVTVVVDPERDLHLRLPNGPWRRMWDLPTLKRDGYVLDAIWVLQLNGLIIKVTGDPSPYEECIRNGMMGLDGKFVEYNPLAWAPTVQGEVCPERPPLYHQNSNSPASWPTNWGELKGLPDERLATPKEPAKGGLGWLADFLEHIVPPLAKAFREEPPAKTFRPGDKAKSAEDVSHPFHEELKEIGKVVEAAKAAEPEPVEMDPVDNRDWTQGMYKTANDYDVPPIPGYDDFSREHHEGIVRSVLRDLIREKTRDQTLDEYMANFTPMEFYILQGLATGQEHFVDTRGLAAFNYDRLYRSGFITRVPVTFGPRLDRNTRQGMGGGAGGTGNVPGRAYASGGGCGYEVWALTPLGQQFMAYLLARDNRRYVAKNRSDQSK